MSSKSGRSGAGGTVVLGANGYLGRHLCLALAAAGRAFVPSGRAAESVDGHAGYVQADLADPAPLGDALADAGTVFAFAGRTGTLDGFDAPEAFLDANERGLLNLLNLLRARGAAPRVVFPSTRLVYRGDPTRALPEDAPKACKTVYAMTKLAGESYLRMYRDLFGIPCTVLRICVPYGNSVPGAQSFGTMQHFVSKASAGQTLTIFGEGEQRRTLTHAEDLAQLTLTAARMPETEGQVLNLGGPDVLSIAQIAERVAAHYGVDVTCVPWPRAHEIVESGDTVFDDAALRRHLEPAYRWTFDEWLATLPGRGG